MGKEGCLFNYSQGNYICSYYWGNKLFYLITMKLMYKGVGSCDAPDRYL